MKHFYLLFNPKSIISSLNPDEKKVLPILIDAAKKLDHIYSLQKNEKFSGANFYPHDIAKERIKNSAQNKPELLLPFTIVEEDKNGQLVAIHYHQKYSQFLQPIADLIKNAALKAKNKSFQKYLLALGDSLLNGNYQKADIAWLGVKDSNIDVTLGPYERNLDKSFFTKRAYQAHVGIIDKENTQNARNIRDILYRNIGFNHHRLSPPRIVDIKVEHNLISSGLLGDLLFSQQHLPSDSQTTEKHGSRIIGYLNSIDYKFEKLIYPIFEAIFEKSFRSAYSKTILKKGNYLNALLQSLAQQLHRYQNSRENLRELFPFFDEANSIVTGVQNAKHLVLKGVINQKELEAIMISFVCWIFSEWVVSRRTKSRENYLIGDALTLNFLMREGALREQDGISWPNFARMFFEIENLSTIFTRILENDTYDEAKGFLSKYLSFEIFKAFEKRLIRIEAP